ncbi:hypothetical protein [Microcoleus sp. CAWBG58]|uniref:hypothetical protein n=1 Tax=Microcoleus sp. CAWBG58 TaxID=2841651 RepID=UPI0025EC2BA1|nr:hypothetical protein [Microcoleus sp. CAWBG58]
MTIAASTSAIVQGRSTIRTKITNLRVGGWDWAKSGRYHIFSAGIVAVRSHAIDIQFVTLSLIEVQEWSWLG